MLTKEQNASIVESFVTGLVPMIELAKEYGVCRQAIWKIINKAGVDISSQSVLTVSCYACGEPITRTRGRVRKNKHHYCDFGCYQAFLDAGNGNAYKPNRQGQRMARKVVSEVFDLLPEHIVHHEDRNCLSNGLYNLKVFANQGDHVRHHRLGSEYVTPLWEGAV